MSFIYQGQEYHGGPTYHCTLCGITTLVLIEDEFPDDEFISGLKREHEIACLIEQYADRKQPFEVDILSGEVRFV